MRVTIYAPFGSAKHQVFEGDRVAVSVNADHSLVVMEYPTALATFGPDEWSGYRVDRVDPPIEHDGDPVAAIMERDGVDEGEAVRRLAVQARQADEANGIFL